jgi:hypothetical protein
VTEQKKLPVALAKGKRREEKRGEETRREAKKNMKIHRLADTYKERPSSAMVCMCVYTFL